MEKSAVEHIESKIFYMIPSSLKSDVIKILEQAKKIENEQRKDYAAYKEYWEVRNKKK